jgi:hypothetical protein
MIGIGIVATRNVKLQTLLTGTVCVIIAEMYKTDSMFVTKKSSSRKLCRNDRLYSRKKIDGDR